MTDKQARQCFVRQSNFDELLADLTPAQQTICTALRQQLLALPESLSEVVWRAQKRVTYGLIRGDAAVADNFAYISIDHEVRLGFYYAEALDDPAGLLSDQGTVVIPNGGTETEAALADLLMAALLQRKRA